MDYLYEDTAWLYLERYDWPVTPELLFAAKAFIVESLDTVDEAKGLDIGY